MSKRLSKAPFSRYVTPFDIKHSYDLVHGIMDVASDGLNVLSVIRLKRYEGMVSVVDEKHLVFFKNNDTITIDQVLDQPDYLNVEDFVKVFAKSLKEPGVFENTIIALHSIDEDPELSLEKNLQVPYSSRRSWPVEDFLDLPKNFGSDISILPPDFYILDVEFEQDAEEENAGIVVVDLNKDEEDVLDALTTYVNPEGETHENDSISWFIREAGEGDHNIFATWDDFEGDSITGDIRVVLADGSYGIQVENQITGPLKYSLFVQSVTNRINAGLPLHVFVQTFDLNDEEGDASGIYPYTICGWFIENGSFQALEESRIREVVPHAADEGDVELTTATFAKGTSLELTPVA